MFTNRITLSSPSVLPFQVGSIPEIVQAPSKVGFDIQSNGTLPCVAIGIPPPKVSLDLCLSVGLFRCLSVCLPVSWSAFLYLSVLFLFGSLL